MKKNWNMFMFVLAVPLLILLGMAVKPVSAYMFGKEVVLETAPFDPRDLLYGDYVSLQLAISDIPKELLEPSVVKELENNDDASFFSKSVTVYTSLIKEDGVYIAKEVTLAKPKKGLYLKGKIQVYSGILDQPTIYVDYGIDRYYVEENTGKHFEQEAQKGDIRVALKVKDGYGLIERLQF
ncbi:MAG: GDYXXLXY domain-containing protein [Bacillus sp. (in: firmicutes)]